MSQKSLVCLDQCVKANRIRLNSTSATENLHARRIRQDSRVGMEHKTHDSPSVTYRSTPDILTKLILLAKLFNVLGWLSPAVIKIKVLLKGKPKRDDPVPDVVGQIVTYHVTCFPRISSSPISRILEEA